MMEGQVLRFALQGDYPKALILETAEYMSSLLRLPQQLARQPWSRISAVLGQVPGIENNWRNAVETEFSEVAERANQLVNDSLRGFDKLIRPHQFNIKLSKGETITLSACPWCGAKNVKPRFVLPEGFQPPLLGRIISSLGLASCSHTLSLSAVDTEVIKNQQHILDSPVT